MAIFSPTSKPATLVTGTLVEPAGIVITGPSGSGCHSVVGLPAAVPTLAILRVSAPAPVSMAIVSPADHAGRAPDVDGVVALARAGPPARSRRGRAGRSRGPRASSRPGSSPPRRWPAGSGAGSGVQLEMSTAAGAGVVELDERVRRVGGRTVADAELVDLDRADVPHLLGGGLGLLLRRWPGWSTRRCRPGRR